MCTHHELCCLCLMLCRILLEIIVIMKPQKLCKKFGNVLKCNMFGLFALLLLLDFKFVNFLKKNIDM